MLVFSGLGAFVSERYLDRARNMMPKIFIAIGVLLVGYGLFLDRVLDLIGTLPYALRLLLCFALIFPPAFLMGFPMPTAMTSLARLGKDHMFLWAWGINGCFSVIGAAAGADHRDLVRAQRRAGRSPASPICWRCRPSSPCCCPCNRQRRLRRRRRRNRRDRGDASFARLARRRARCCRPAAATGAVSAPAPKRELAPLPTLEDGAGALRGDAISLSRRGAGQEPPVPRCRGR